MIKYYTNKDMRKILNCSQSTVDRQVRSMNLKVVRFGVQKCSFWGPKSG